MNSSAATCSDDNTANEVAELLEAALENRGQEVLRILETKPELLRIGDLVGDTALHVVARSGHVDALKQMTGFLQSKNPELLATVAKQGNGNGDTPLHLALMNGHREAALLLFDVEPKVSSIRNEDGELPCSLAKELADLSTTLLMQHLCSLREEQVLELSDDNDRTLGIMTVASNRYKQLLTPLHFRVRQCDMNTADIELDIMTDRSCKNRGEILEILEANLTLIQFKNQRGNTVFHEAAFSGNIDMLTKLLMITSHDDQIQLQLPRLTDVLLERNKYGNTALHLAIRKKHTKAARYLMEVAPEAAYQVNNEGKSPLCLALEYGYDDLVKYILQVMPEASFSPATRHTLLTSNKASLPHAAIRARNLTMLEMILESLPSLIDFSDEKGWRPLSYAAYKGYLQEVQFFLNKFPESATKFDADGSLPIHKAISGGHISILKEFISSQPHTLYAIDKKGRNILHVVVTCAKADILSYLTHHDNKTFVDLGELKHN